jgi:hypothetical protein
VEYLDESDDDDDDDEVARPQQKQGKGEPKAPSKHMPVG